MDPLHKFHSCNTSWLFFCQVFAHRLLNRLQDWVTPRPGKEMIDHAKQPSSIVSQWLSGLCTPHPMLANTLNSQLHQSTDGCKKHGATMNGLVCMMDFFFIPSSQLDLVCITVHTCVYDQLCTDRGWSGWETQPSSIHQEACSGLAHREDCTVCSTT